MPSHVNMSNGYVWIATNGATMRSHILHIVFSVRKSHELHFDFIGRWSGGRRSFCSEHSLLGAGLKVDFTGVHDLCLQSRRSSGLRKTEMSFCRRHYAGRVCRSLKSRYNIKPKIEYKHQERQSQEFRCCTFWPKNYTLVCVLKEVICHFATEIEYGCYLKVREERISFSHRRGLFSGS